MPRVESFASHECLKTSDVLADINAGPNIIRTIGRLTAYDRRTVAKYREAMNIASSVQRRREKRALAKVAGF